GPSPGLAATRASIVRRARKACRADALRQPTHHTKRRSLRRESVRSTSRTDVSKRRLRRPRYAPPPTRGLRAPVARVCEPRCRDEDGGTDLESGGRWRSAARRTWIQGRAPTRNAPPRSPGFHIDD